MNTTLRENIDWVGCVDWTVRDFHGYNTDRGATYNAYLIRDEKTALIDTVKAPFALLGIIGGKMLLNACSSTGRRVSADPSRGWRLVALSLATSIALVGMPIVIAYSVYIYRVFAGKVVITQEGY